MSRKAENESGAAGTEALRGALVGTAKVKKILEIYIRNSPVLTHFAIGSPTLAILIRTA